MNDLHALAAFKALDEGRLQPVDKGGVVVTMSMVTPEDREAARQWWRKHMGLGQSEDLAIAFARHRHQSETGAALTSVNEKSVMVCPQCEGEGGYPDGLDEAACHTDCTRCDGNGWIVDIAALAQPVEAGEDGLRAQIAKLEDERDEALAGPWPKWASDLLDILREYTGPCPEDSWEGVDLPEEMRVWLEGYRDEMERAALGTRP